MNNNKLKSKITAILRVNAPIKARQIAAILSQEFDQYVNRGEVNSILYSMKSAGDATVNNSYEWCLSGDMTKKEKTEVVEPVLFFTSEQQNIIDLDPSGHLLIRGQAGSGKTTVLAARAGKILSIMNQGRLLFITYNAALNSYIKKAFKKNDLHNDIEIRTFHEWTKHTAQELGYPSIRWVDSKDRKEKLKLIINELIGEHGEHRLYDYDQFSNWWADEITWLFGQGLAKLEDYEKAERTGRGNAIRLSMEDRKYVWMVFEAYNEWLEEQAAEDYDNPGGLVLRALMITGQELPEKLRYDHVFIDEVQDFDKSWLISLAKASRISLSLAGDISQKIYKRNFTWASVGIKVQGARSKKLSGTHRTTRSIMEVAHSLIKNLEICQSPDYTEPEMPIREGEKVNRIFRSTPTQAYNDGYSYIAKNFKRLRKTTVAIAMPFSKQLYHAQKQLEKLGVNATRAKGSSLGKITDGGIVVTTYHQLKGLEFDHVVLMGLHDSQIPGIFLENIPQEDHFEEEQLLCRLLYVGMTRAKQTLTLVGSNPFCRFFNGLPSALFQEI